jgi:ribosomal protein S18 acetylase RimI-like enzyme
MYPLFLKHWGGWNPQVFQDNFNKNNTKIIEYKTKRIAYYTLIIKEKFSYIDNVQVSTIIRGKGLRTFLIKQMEKDTKKHKLKKIRLKVFKDNKAKNLYLKLGYKKIKDEKTAIILEKKIK